MKILLGENIKNNRKRLNLTQEKLAEVLGVTIGAVHKWEAGICAPELSMLIKMASFFEVSVDVLLGYEIENNSLSTMVARLKDYGDSKDEAGLEVADIAVKKYPNNFEIIYKAAGLYFNFGIVKNDRELFNKAIEYYEKCIPLLSQNTDPEINESVIWYYIASSHDFLGNHKKSLKILKAHNPARVNHALIGTILSGCMGDMKEAEGYLSWALTDNISNLLKIVTGFISVYMSRNDMDNLRGITDLVINYMENLRKEDKVYYLDKVLALFYTINAYSYLNSDIAECKKVLKKGLKSARAFDESPDYSSDNLKFLHFDKTYMGYDTLGETAIGAIEKFIKDNNDKKFTDLYEKIKNGKL
ncbi:MAG: helix-turn-helix transcriptional regulator [Lachnospiraceae bacterium]|nr:helix-turn-helix transcriptional regulator [Lachnospiraceae bacterium]